LAGDARPAARRCPDGRWPTAATQRRDDREPVRQDDGNRGLHGYETQKHVNGRKRHILVDTRGVLLAVVVTAASVQAREGAIALLASLRHRFSRMCLIWADQASSGDLVAWLWGLRPWRNVRLEMVKRPEGTKGFLLLPQRWMVERTFAWLGRYRRLSKDDAYSPRTSEAMIRVAMIHLMVRRLAHLIPS